MKRCVIAVLAGLALAAGCQKPLIEPRVCSQSAFTGDQLRVDVYAKARKARHEPYVYKLEIETPGERGEAVRQVWHWKGWHYGWLESVRFEAPPGVRRFHAILSVRYMGQDYRMLVPFERVAPHEGFRWWRSNEKVVFAGSAPAEFTLPPEHEPLPEPGPLPGEGPATEPATGPATEPTTATAPAE